MKPFLCMLGLLIVLSGCGGSGGSGSNSPESDNTGAQTPDTNEQPNSGSNSGQQTDPNSNTVLDEEFKALCQQLIESDDFTQKQETLTLDHRTEILLAMYIHSGKANESMVDCPL